MAKIEIPLSEYEALLSSKDKLEKDIVLLNKKLEENEEIILKQQNALEYILEEISSLERIFQWGQIKKAVKTHLKG